MSALTAEPLELSLEVERWALVKPFRISGYIFEHVDVLVVTLGRGGVAGRGDGGQDS